MISVFKKEVISFFSSLMGYISMAVFLLVTGLFLWVFPDTNILDYGFASLDGFFTLAPWVFMFLIPAITMRLFAEEFKEGTFEILSTKPLTNMQIILGKYLGAFFLVVVALVPTILYYFTVHMLGDPVGNLDTGAALGSYLGLLFLAGSFVAIGIFASSLTDNQIISFIIGMFFCFFFYIAFDYLSGLNIFYAKIDNLIQQIGINAHYTSISRGVLDTRDVIYFASIISVFILLTRFVVENRK